MGQPQGKIARLPHDLREQVNRRLRDNEPAAKVISWLNPMTEVIQVCEEYFDGEPITPQNLSAWRLGGYREWLRRQESVENTKTRAAFAVELVKAGGNQLSQAGLAVAAGEILEFIESPAGKDPDELAKYVKSLLGVSREQLKGEKLELDKALKNQRDQLLTLKKQEREDRREKWELDTVEKFYEWAGRPEAQAILKSGDAAQTQMADLRRLIFGNRKAVPNASET